MDVKNNASIHIYFENKNNKTKINIRDIYVMEKLQEIT